MTYYRDIRKLPYPLAPHFPWVPFIMKQNETFDPLRVRSLQFEYCSVVSGANGLAHLIKEFRFAITTVWMAGVRHDLAQDR
jgi:hypothetical protein